MNKPFLMVFASLLASLVITPAYADKKTKQRYDFSKTVTINNEKGSGTRTIEQRVNDNGFTRTINTQFDDGRMAAKQITVIRDTENKTRTKEVTGTRLNGESFYKKSQLTKTDTGFIREGSTINAEGKTATRHVVATVNQDTGMVSKEITRVNFEGETTTETVVVPKGHKKNGQHKQKKS